MAGLSPEEQQVLMALQDAGVPTPDRYKPHLACLYAGHFRSADAFKAARRESLISLHLPFALVDLIMWSQSGEECWFS